MSHLRPKLLYLPCSNTMIALGTDPDSKDCAFATWDEDGPLYAHVAHVVGKSSNYEILEALAEDTIQLGPPEVVAIEGQQIDSRRARPKDLFKLAHVTGAAALRVRQLYPDARILIPTPYEWKKAVAKHAMQARLYDDLGWGYTIIGRGKQRYARPVQPPTRFTHITPGQWKHVGDALLLARWAHQQNQ